MLLLLLSLFSRYDLIECYNVGRALFNESQLTDNLHKSLREVHAFLDQVEQSHKRSHKLRSVDKALTKPAATGQDFLDYGISNIWWNDTLAEGYPSMTPGFSPHIMNSTKSELNDKTLKTDMHYTGTVSLPESWTSANTTPPATGNFGPNTTSPELVLDSEAKKIPGYFPVSELPPFPDTPMQIPIQSPKYFPGETYPWTTAEVVTVSYPPEIYYDGGYSSTPASGMQLTGKDGYMTSIQPSVYLHVQKWLQEQVNSTAYVDYLKWLNTASSDSMTHMMDLTTKQQTVSLQEIQYIVPKSANWVENKNLDQNRSQYRMPASPPVHRQRLIVTTFVPEYEDDPGHPTATAKQEQFIIEQPNGLFSLGTTPPYDESTRTTIIEGRPAYVPVEVDLNWASSTVAGDVLMGDVTTPPSKDMYKEELYEEMDEENLGFLSMFITRIAYLVASKNENDTQEVLDHVEFIMNNDYFNPGHIAWLGQPLIHVVMNLAIGLSDPEERDVLRSYATMIYHMLKHRKEALAVDVNSIIDYADMLYTDAEGERLFDLLKEFEMYPNITKPSKVLAEDIIEAFFAPYRRLATSDRRQRLLDSVNYALIIRFPNLESLRRSNEEFGPDLIGQDKPHPTPKHPAYDLKIHRRENQRKKIRNHRFNISKDITYVGPHKRSRIKRQHKNQENRHPDHNYAKKIRRLYSEESEAVQLRRTKPIRGIQKRYNIISSKKLFIGLNHPPPSLFYDNLTADRPTTDYRTKQMIQSELEYRPIITNSDTRMKFFQESSDNSEVMGELRHDSTAPFTAADRDESKRHGSTLKIERLVKKIKDTKPLKITGKHDRAERLKLKAKILQKIDDGSSYSDEEVKLKMNLVDALLHGNRTFETESVEENHSKFDKLRTTSQVSESYEGDESLSRTISKSFDGESSSWTWPTSNEQESNPHTHDDRAGDIKNGL